MLKILLPALVCAALKADNMAFALYPDLGFGTLDLTTGAAAILSHPSYANASNTVEFVGLDGKLYAGIDGELNTVDPATGQATSVNNTITGCCVFFGGTTTALFGLDNDLNLFSINPVTGVPTLIGPTGQTFQNPLGLVLSNNGTTLYLADSGDNFTGLYAINTSTGAATLAGKIRNFVGPGGPDILAMVVEGGSLWASVPGGIPSLDRIDVFAGGAAIGNQTPITDFFLSPTALAPDPLLSGQPSSVPEPACVVPLAVAIGVLLLRRSSESSHA